MKLIYFFRKDPNFKGQPEERIVGGDEVNPKYSIPHQVHFDYIKLQLQMNLSTTYNYYFVMNLVTNETKIRSQILSLIDTLSSF